VSREQSVDNDRHTDL